MLLKTVITEGYMDKGKFFQKVGGDACEVVSVFVNGSIKGFCKNEQQSIKKEIQLQIDIFDRESMNVSNHANS